MALDKLRTASGKRLRSDALTETALPVPYDAAAMPGATVLGTDGRLYACQKVSGTYQWRQLLNTDADGVFRVGSVTIGETVLFGPSVARSNFIRNVTAGPIAYTPSLQFEVIEDPTPAGAGEILSALSTVGINGPGRAVLGRANGASLGDNGAVIGGEPLGHYFFYGCDGTNLVAAGRMRCLVGGTVSSGCVPGLFELALAAEGAPDNLFTRVRVTSSGNILINNTSGTERLSVTGNIQITESANALMVGANGVVGSRKTGWAASTGTATRTTFATSTVTTEQLAERVKALLDDLTTHGLIGT